MKAELILRAIIAMRAAGKVSYVTPPEDFGRAMGNLMAACIDLEVELGAMEIPVDKLEAQEDEAE